MSERGVRDRDKFMAGAAKDRRSGPCSGPHFDPVPALRSSSEAVFQLLPVAKWHLPQTCPEAPHQRSVNYRIRLAALPVKSQHEPTVRYDRKVFGIVFEGHG